MTSFLSVVKYCHIQNKEITHKTRQHKETDNYSGDGYLQITNIYQDI
ncbi:hypothetical protein BCL69_10915 [Nitrosomonas communis]|uniref:Uncharacterized protein n=1 Tax=Nitrosomonas communis TaxID=44574 RepID=A0A5D3Y9P3_9PROT|nr:hypothetical protein BCL69_10915 [Nitrosomonas communis]